MTAVHNQGPSISYGNPPGSFGNNPEAGPNVDFQGSAILDTRYLLLPGMTGVGHAKAMANVPYTCMVDGTPQTKSASLIYSGAPTVPGGGTITVTGQTTDSGLSRAVNVPFVAFGQGLSVANRIASVMAIDPGHTTVTTAVGSKTYTIPSGGDGRLIRAGQFICIPGAAATGVPLITQVVSKSLANDGTGTIVGTVAAGAVVTAGPLMLMDLTGASVIPWTYNGAAALMDPRSMLARRLEYVSSNAGDTTFTATVPGWDVWGVPMSETVTFNGTTVVTGRKAFKYINAAGIVIGKSGGGTPAGTLTIGTSDYFGFPLAVENWEYVNAYWNQTQLTGPTVTGGGYTGADRTVANTTSTTDVRGSYGIGTASPTNGSRRLTVFLNMMPYQMFSTDWNNPAPLFGVPQA